MDDITLELYFQPENRHVPELERILAQKLFWERWHTYFLELESILLFQPEHKFPLKYENYWINCNC